MGFVGRKPTNAPLTSDDIPNGIIGAADLATGLSKLSWVTTVKTSGFTAVAGEGYFCNTTSAGFTVTLPATPSAGDEVIILDYAGTFDTNALVISPNGNKIEGGTSNLQLTGEREGVRLVYIDATQGWLAYSGINEGTDALSAAPYSVDFLVIAGGGSGGVGNNPGGGGGAGGYRSSNSTYGGSGGGANAESSLSFLVGTVYTITVGAGGSSGANGVASSISGSNVTTITSVAGGAGSPSGSSNGNSGGSGGGGDFQSSAVGGSGTANQGFSGGNGGGYIDLTDIYLTGGGGGAGAVGVNGSGSASGNGGVGKASTITGSSVTRAGGGGGGKYDNGTAGSGGTGGGGAGGLNAVAATAGTANTGGGGGGGANNNSNVGAGGSGVVILRMPTANYSSTTTGSPTVSTSGADTILVYTGSGTYTG